MADDAGALLVRSGLVPPSALDEARARVEDLGGTLGEHLVFAAAISDDALTDFYRSRLLVPQVNPNTLARLPVRVIAAIPSDMAIELRAVPVALDAENNLTVAMSDPSDRHAVDEIAFFTGSYVVRAVATQMQIAWCLAHYYGHVTALGQRLLQGSSEPAEQPAPAPVATPAPAPAPAPRTKGLTGKVEAMRHRGIIPATGPVNVQRPVSGQIAIVTPNVPAPVITPVVTPVIVDVSEPVRAASQPAAGSDGVPDKPRTRSVSGEIRIPGRRAESIKPVMEDPLEDESGPVITVEVSLPDDEETGPRKPAPRRRKVKSDPPELYARAGEVNIANDRDRSVDSGPGIIIADELLEPPPQEDRTGEFTAAPRHGGDDSNGAPTQTIEVSDEASAGVVIHASYDRESEPVLLDRRRPSDPPPTEDDEEVVVLDAKKPFTRATRPARPTQVGIGALPAVTRAHRDTEAELDAPTSVDMMAVAPGPDDPSSDEIAAPPAPMRDDTSLHNLAEPPKPSPPRAVTAPVSRKHAPTLDDLDDYDDDRGPATSVMSAVELDDAIPQRSSDVVPAHLATKRHSGVPSGARIAHDDVDDGWGPPGTTIPPPLLGAVPGSADDEVPGRIPVSSVDAAPLIVAPPSPPERARGMPAPVAETSSSHAQKDATSRLLDLIRALEHASDRDGVVGMMVAHLAETHRRAGFLVVKAGATKGVTELSVFTIEPRPLTLPFATLRLDRPSTLQDVVGTRLPYRGPTHDEASRIFLAGVLGVAPVEILLVPVTVRERVVGVLFAEHRLRHTFDDQLALAARAAGEALERILMAKRS